MSNLNGSLQYLQFNQINLADPFFDSLKADYAEFSNWFHRKSNDYAYVLFDEFGAIQGFLYLKEEEGPILDVEPNLPEGSYLKIGTLKINAHGTKLGERFIKKAIDFAVYKKLFCIYVTVFSQHEGLIQLLQRYGFIHVANKVTNNGAELCLAKYPYYAQSNEVEKNYPVLSCGRSQYLLSIYPEFHTRLFPDSILNNESMEIVQDVSHTNSIEKIYICKMRHVENLMPGDAIVIYRTKDENGPAWYRAVATSLCMVTEVKMKSEFSSLESFLEYCRGRTVFSIKELSQYYMEWNKMVVIRMTYNAALQNRIIRKRLVEEVGIDENAYPGFLKLTKQQFKEIAKLGNVDDSLIFN